MGLHGGRESGDLEGVGNDCVRTFDAGLINRIFKHPKVWRHVSDDFSPAREDFDCSSAIGVEGIYFLSVCGGSGIFMFHKHSEILYEVHTLLLPECWGREDIAASAARWMFENTPCEKIITWVPAYNRLAYHFALRSGMKEEGLSRKSIRKNGRLMDQYLLGLEKDTICPPLSQ